MDLDQLFQPENFKARFKLFPFDRTELCNYSILADCQHLKKQVQDLLVNTREQTDSNANRCSPQEDRAIGSLLGLVIGDALGAPLEFQPLMYGVKEGDMYYLTGLEHHNFWRFKGGYNRFGLSPGQWTDDSSMALCLADSLLVNKTFNPVDLRLRFLNWWDFGYNNAFGSVVQHTPDGELDYGLPSVGLGGNINESFRDFQKNQTEYFETPTNNPFNSGNGSAMRLAPVPIFYSNSLEQALDVAYKQSKTTHQGDEAAEACQLMACFIVMAIQNGGTKQEVIDQVRKNFSPKLYSIQCLLNSTNEEHHPENASLNLEDRQWNWQSPQWRYPTSRANENPGYIGSYVMDGLCMALHCLWTTDSFKACLLKAANLRGDADTVCAIAGQLAGAIYGVSSIPVGWIQAVQKWDNGGDIALKAYMLLHKDKEGKISKSGVVIQPRIQETRKQNAYGFLLNF